jgi:hypothetical protein
MHCEKNLAINISKTILEEKDAKKIRNDMQDLGTYESLWLKPHPNRANEIVMLPTTYVLPKKKNSFFLETMAKLKLPTRYALSFKKHILKGKLATMN